MEKRNAGKPEGGCDPSDGVARWFTLAALQGGPGFSRKSPGTCRTCCMVCASRQGSGARRDAAKGNPMPASTTRQRSTADVIRSRICSTRRTFFPRLSLLNVYEDLLLECNRTVGKIVVPPWCRSCPTLKPCLAVAAPEFVLTMRITRSPNRAARSSTLCQGSNDSTITIGRAPPRVTARPSG